ncbi:hypothetical protein QQF64_032063, partial [Cirrhinus molitorella]
TVQSTVTVNRRTDPTLIRKIKGPTKESPIDRCASGKASRHALDNVSADDKVVRMGKDTTSESKHQISKEVEDKIIKLLEIFPQKSKKDLLEVVESTSTLEGAIAHCLMIYGEDNLVGCKSKTGHSEDDDMITISQRRGEKL